MNKKTLLIGFVILIAVIVYAAVTVLDFPTPNTDELKGKCGSDTSINCFNELSSSGGFVRFFTMTHEDGTTERVIMIEEFPLPNIREPER